PFTYDDAFFDDLGASLPDCSAAFLNRACAWTARNSKSGFVPSSQLARLSDDPDLVTRTLHAAGIMNRVKGGWRIAEGKGITIVNASDVAEQVTRDNADAERKRIGARERKRRQRDAAKAERREEIAADVTPMSRGRNRNVTRDIRVTSRGTTGPPHARADDDFDLDFNQPAQNQVSQSGVINAGTREAPATIAAVIDAARTRNLAIGAAEAVTAIARVRARPKTPKHIHDPVKYFTAAIENEDDLYAELFDEPPPLAEILAGFAADGARGGDRHPYDPDPRTGVCRCDRPKSNWQHEQRS